MTELDFDAMTIEELRAYIEQQKAAVATPNKYSNWTSPIRGAIAGATAEFDDEIAGAVAGLNPFDDRSFGEIYRETQQEWDQAKKERAAEDPWLMGGGRVAGAAGTLAIPGAAALRGVQAVTAGAPRAAQIAAMGATMMGEGAALGALESMGAADADEDLGDAALRGAKWGAVAAPVGGALGYGAAKAGKGMLRLGRYIMDTAGGKTGANIVEAEVQKIAQATGRDVDEIADHILNGGTFADMTHTTRALTRTLRDRGGPAADFIADTAEERAPKVLRETSERMQERLAPDHPGNIVAAEAARKKAFAGDVNAAYSKSAANAPFLTPKETADLEDLINAVHGKKVSGENTLVADINAKSRGERLGDIFVDGRFTRPVTWNDAEMIRSRLSNTADIAHKAGRTDSGTTWREMATELRDVIDQASPSTTTARDMGQVAIVAKKAFPNGQRAARMKSHDDAMMLWKEAQEGGEEGMKAFRAGVMSALKADLASAGGVTTARKLSDPNRYMAQMQLLEAIWPDQNAEEIMMLLRRAVDAGDLRTKALTGSHTPEQLAAQKRMGVADNITDAVSLVEGNPAAGLNIIRRSWNAMFDTNPTDAQMLEVARIMMSEDPDLVRRALTDNSAAARLQDIIERVARRTKLDPRGNIGATGAATVGQTIFPPGEGP